MSAPVTPLLFPQVLNAPGMWRSLGQSHGLSIKDFDWLAHVQLATDSLRREQTPPMLAHRVRLHSEGAPPMILAGCFILSSTPEDRAFLLYSPFDGLRKFATLAGLTRHLEQHLNTADEDDRLLALLAIVPRKLLVEKRGISVSFELIEGDVFDDQKAAIEHCRQINAQGMIEELLRLPELDRLLEDILKDQLSTTMPGVDQSQTRVSFYAAASSGHEPAQTRGTGRLLDTLPLGLAVLLHYRHSGWPGVQTPVYSHPHKPVLAADHEHWEAAVSSVCGKLPALLSRRLQAYWSAPSADGNARKDFFTRMLREQARADILLKREGEVIDTDKCDNLMAWIEPHSVSGRRGTLESVQLWEYQPNHVELAGSLMLLHTDACLYTPTHGLQVFRDYKDLKNTLLSRFKATGHDDELYGLLSLEERQRSIGFEQPVVSGEVIGGDVFKVLLEAIITKQRKNIEYVLQVFRHSDGAVDLAALFDKALDIRSMLHERLLPLDTGGRWSTRLAITGSQLPSMLLADVAAAQIKVFSSVLPMISAEFSAQPLTTLAQQRAHLQGLESRLAHSLFVGVTGEARLRVLNGSQRRPEQAIVDTVFNADRPERQHRNGLNGFRPDAWALSVQTTGLADPLPLANCVLLTERGGLDAQHSGRAVLWTPAMGLEIFTSIDNARKALNQRLRDPVKRLVLLENLSPLIDGFHRRYTLGPLRLITDSVMRNRMQSAIEQFLQRCERVRSLKLSASRQEQALEHLRKQMLEVNLNRATALARALNRQQTLPTWLGMAPLDEQQLHLELLEQWRHNVVDGKDYLHGLPTLRDYIQRAFKTLLSSRYQATELDPQHIQICPVLALAGPPVSLVDFALNHAHLAGQIRFTVASNGAQPLPAGFDQQAVRSLLQSVDLPGFTDTLSTALSGDDADAALRKRRFLRALPWQLLQHAHQLKLQQRLSATAFDLLIQVLDMPDALARKTVPGANAMIRPVQLIKTAGAAAINALGLYLIGPASGETGPQVLYSPYHGERVFREFDNDAAVIAAFNRPGALQDLLLRRLPDDQQAIFAGLSKASVGLTSEISLALPPIAGNALEHFFKDNLALLPRLLHGYALSAAQEDWEAAKNLFNSSIKPISGLLPGKVAYVQFLWHSYKDFLASAEALQDHHWSRALGAFIAGCAEMVSLGRLSLESTLSSEDVTPEPTATTTSLSVRHWKQIRTTSPDRTTLQSFEASSIALKDLKPNPADGTYQDLASKTRYAAIAGKVYPVEKPGAVWRIKGIDQPGPVLQHTATRQLVLDPDRHTVHFGKALSKMYERYANGRETRQVLNIEAQGMAEIRARHPEKARLLTQAIDLARYYAFNSLHNLTQLRQPAIGSRLDVFLRGFFDVPRVDAAVLEKIRQAIVPICNALVDPTEDLMNTERFVVGSNKYSQSKLIAFVLDNDSSRKVHFTEKFFNQGLDWYHDGLTQPFNVHGHAQAATLIHEFAHQITHAVDIASLEARRPFTDLISTITGYGAALKVSQTRFQREALSLATPHEELFSVWSRELGDWASMDSIPGMSHIGKEIIKATGRPTLEEARSAFLDPQNTGARINTILRNADSIAFLICEMGRQLDPVAQSVEVSS
ncbi:dermonecrotic toxin domain-containing protein [Pseudomonas sp. Eth.TT006]